jgi:hypothetical protein
MLEGISLLGLNHARVRNQEYYNFGFSGSIGTIFKLCSQQEEDVRGNSCGGQLSKLSGYINLEEEGLKDYTGELRNVRLSPPLQIQPNVWHILFMHNLGDSEAYFVNSY